MIDLPEKKLNQLRVLLSALPESVTDKLCLVAESADPYLYALLNTCLPPKDNRDEIACRRLFEPLDPICSADESLPPSKRCVPSNVLQNIWEWLKDFHKADITDPVTKLSNAADSLSEDLDELRGGVADCLDNEVSKVRSDARAEMRLKAQLEISDLQVLETVSLLMRSTPVLRRALSDIPLGIMDVNEDLSSAIRDQYDWIVEQDGAAGVWFLSFIMVRVDKPWTVLRAFERITGRADDLLVSQTDMARVGGTLLADAEFYLQGFSTVPTDYESANHAADALAKFSAISVGITREIGVRKDGAWGKRLFQLRDQASQAMTRIHFQARSCIEKALPESVTMRKRRSTDPPNFEQATALARFLGQTRNDAGRAAVGSTHNSLIADMAEACDSAGQSILADLRLKACENPEAVHERMEQIAAILEGLGYEDDASILVRRTVAALAA
jgi:hypothetical protein